MAKMPVEGGFDGRPEERTAEVVNLQTSSPPPHCQRAEDV